jgi:hypothetical protein
MSDIKFTLTAHQSAKLATLMAEEKASGKIAVIAFASVSYEDGIASVILSGRLIHKKAAVKIARILQREH